MNYPITLVVCAVVGVTTSYSNAQPASGISGTLDEDQLFVADPISFPKQRTYGSKLVRGSIYDRLNTNSGFGTYVPYSSIISGREGVCKVHVTLEQLWYVAPGSPNFYVIPFGDLSYYEGSEWARKRAEAQLGNRAKDFSDWHLYWVNQLFDSAIQGVNIHQLLKDSPLKGFNGAPLNIMDYDSMLIRNTFYDLIPTGTNLFTLVHLTAGMMHMPKDMLVIQEMKLGTSHRDKRNEWTKPLPDSKPFIVKAPFEGDFWAYEVGGVYYLLTRKGKLYAVKKNKESVVTSTIWQDEKKYLIGAIQDVAKGTVYAFGVDGKDGERFAFEFGLEPKVTKYKTEAKVGDGFKEAQDCVRAMKPAAQKK